MKKLNLETLENKLGETVSSDLAANNIGGASIAVYQEGQPLFRSCYGKTNTNTGAAMQPHTLFRLASMTKPVTAAAVLLQVQAGKLQLDDPISKYLPIFASMTIGKEENGKVVPSHPASAPILVYHLLTHTSGILAADFVGCNQPLPREAMQSLETVVNYYGEHILLSNEPLGNALYSPCAAFDVAARLVEITSGKSYETFLKEHLFAPLGMTDTTFTPSEDQWSRMTAMHNKENDQNTVIAMEKLTFGDFPLSYTCGGASLCSTVEDYCHFADMLLHGGSYAGKQILKPEIAEKMYTNCIPNTVPGIAPSETWGLGVRVITNDPVLPKGAFGWSGAYGTHFWVDPANRLYAVYAKNSAYDGGSGAMTARTFERAVMAALQD